MISKHLQFNIKNDLINRGITCITAILFIFAIKKL